MDCREFLDAWLDLRQESSQSELVDGSAAELRSHASSCATCAQLERRMTITVGLLATLETRSAPEALDFAVGIEVGEDEAARGEMRVARIFRQLTPLACPQALDRRVAGLFSCSPGRAPEVLDRLVDEVLRGDSSSEQDLKPVESEVLRRIDLRLRGGLSAPKRRRRPVLLGVFLGLAVGWMGAVTLERVSHPPVVVAKASHTYSFEVVVHDSFESLRAATPGLSGLTEVASRISGDQL